MKNNILYSQQTCGQCKAVKMMLNNNNIPYEVCEDLDVMKDKKISHTPTLEANGELLTGGKLIEWIRNYNL